MKFLLFCLLIAFVACKSRTVPRGILERDKMQAVLWDVIRADVFTRDYLSKDSSKNLLLENAGLQAGIFNQHHITRKEFYDSYDYYLHNSEQFRVILDSLGEKQRRVHDSTKRQLLRSKTR